MSAQPVDNMGTTEVVLVEQAPPAGDYPGWNLPCLVPADQPTDRYLNDDTWRDRSEGAHQGPRPGHRQAYAEFVGLHYYDPEMPESVHHRCGVKACRQIGHLEGLTHRDHATEHTRARR